MKRLKIGIITDQLLPGGVQLSAIEQVKTLNTMGYKAKLLILMRKKYKRDYTYLVKNTPHQYLSDSYPKFFRRTVKFPIFSFLSTLHLASPLLAPRLIKKNDYDILVSLGTTTSLTTQAIYKKIGIPYIAVIHDPIEYILLEAYSKTFLRYFFFLLKPIARYFEQSFLKDAKKTIIISKVHKQYLKENYAVSPTILGFGTRIIKSLPKKRGDTILSFGRWQKEKNPDFILSLAKEIPKVRFVIAGTWTNPKELNQFEKKIKEKKLSDRIIIHSYYDEKLLDQLCVEARCFMNPHFEAFGLAALEAAGHGLPIIVPKNSGVTEYFKSGVHGFYPKRNNISEYKKYLVQLLLDERQAYSMGKAAWQHIKVNFSWKANSQKLLTIINTVLQPSKPTILVLEISHAIGKTLAGGDKLMEPMAKRLSNLYQFTIVIPRVGIWHWKNTISIKRLFILPKNRFEESGSPVSVFLSYCIRMWQTIQIVKQQKDIDILYSSTNILPDILPLFFIKILFLKKVWIARIHHLIPPPHKREGKLVINIASFIMQKISLFMIKKEANMIIALNHKLKKQLIESGFSQKNVKVVGAGINYNFIRHQKKKDNHRFDAVFLGRLHPSKGIFDLLPIWKQVLKETPKAKLAIIGVGTESIVSQLKEFISKERLKKNITILGFLPDKEMISIMKGAKLFLFTDHEAGWGLAVAEAMAAGLPIVGYNNGVLGNVFKKGYKSVTMGDHVMFGQEVSNLLKNKKKRKKMSDDAVQEAAQHDWNYTSAQFNSLIQSVVNHNYSL